MPASIEYNLDDKVSSDNLHDPAPFLFTSFVYRRGVRICQVRYNQISRETQIPHSQFGRPSRRAPSGSGCLPCACSKNADNIFDGERHFRMWPLLRFIDTTKSTVCDHHLHTCTVVYTSFMEKDPYFPYLSCTNLKTP